MLLSALSSQQSASLKAASFPHAPLVLPSLPTGFSPLFLITVLTKVFNDASSTWFKSHSSYPLFLDLLAASDIWLASFKRWIFFSLCAFMTWPIPAFCSVFLTALCQIPCCWPLISITRTLPVPCSPGRGTPGLINLVPWQTSAPTHGLNFSYSLTFPEVLASVIFQCTLPSAGMPSQLPFGLLPGHPSGLSLDGMTSGWTSLIFAQLSPLTWASSITLTLFSSNYL